MLLSVIDEFNEYEKKYGLIKPEDLKQLIAESERLDFDCLAFVSFETDTIFNQLQMRNMLKELDILCDKTDVNKALLDNIKKAIQFGLTEDYMYIKFERMNNQLGTA